MKQQIKAGDYVYVPTYSRMPLLVEIDKQGMPFVYINDRIQPFIDKNGFNSVHHIEPIAFLATPKIKMATLSIPHDNS